MTCLYLIRDGNAAKAGHLRVFIAAALSGLRRLAGIRV